MNHPVLKNLTCSILVLLLHSANNNSLAAETARVSVSSSGVQGNKDSKTTSISANGRFVAFASASDNLVTGDTNGSSYGMTDIFVHDRLTRVTDRTSVGTSGSQANGVSFDPSISADGRYVTFVSDASNLVAGDTNKQDDVFLYNRQTKTTIRASVGPASVQGNGANKNPVLNSDGRFVAFASTASNLVAGDVNNSSDIFVYDRLTKQTARASVSSAGAESNSESYHPAISADGRFVAFVSDASNLVAGDTNKTNDVFVHDRQTKQTTRVSLSTAAAQANNFSFAPALSANGRFVAFMSLADNLVTGDANSAPDIFVYDSQTKQTSRVSVSTAGVEGNKASEFPAISADGRYVAFDSLASNLVAGDTGFSDVFVHDRTTKQTTRASVSSSGIQADFHSANVKINADGRYLAFYSAATNLVAGDSNSIDDIFIRDRNLANGFKADLNLTATTQPISLAKNSQGSFVYTITNNGPSALAWLRIQHILSNGQLIALTPQTGTCTTYASISLCEIKNLAVGASMTLKADIKALRNVLGQQLSVSTNGYADPNMTNNYLDIATTVTP